MKLHTDLLVGADFVPGAGAEETLVNPATGQPITVLRDRVPCSPCWLRVCPIEGHPCLDPMRVNQAQRKLAARHKIGNQRVPLAHTRLLAGQSFHELRGFFFPPIKRQAAVPDGVVAVHRELIALPSGQ